MGEAPAVPAQIGKYAIVRLLGQGAMGAVYLAAHAELHRQVALKLLPADADEEMTGRFQREARAAARLRHRGIVAVHDVGEDAGRQYFTMDYITGGTLHDRLKPGRMPVRPAFELARKIADALDFAHRQGVIHRDLKPQNIMLDESGEPLLVDFGLARLVDDAALSQSGVVIGTPAFMAPEQARGENRKVDARSDVWSLGACLYTMLAGAQPFTGSGVVDILMKISNTEPVPLRRHLPGVPRDAEAIVFKCLTKEPERRYQTATELRDDLDRFLDGRPVVARPVTPLRRAAAWVRRNRALAATAALGALGIAFTLAYTLWAAPALRAFERASRIERLERDAREQALANQRRLMDELESPSRDLDAIVRDAKDVPRQIRAHNPVADPAEHEAVERGVAAYRAAPILSRAYFLKKEWSLAYRYDPTGRWGLMAQVEMAAALRAGLRLHEAAEMLGRIRSRAPASEAAKRAVAELGNVFLEQGRLDDALAAYAESGARPERVRLLEAVIGERAVVTLPATVQGIDTLPNHYEPFHVLRVGDPLIVLPRRPGRPAFRLARDGLVPVPSPLAMLPDSDQVAEVCDADVDGDGRRELVMTLIRPGTGTGFAIVDRDGDRWTLRGEPTLANSAGATHIAAGDVDGDGRDEVFVIFNWRTAHQWIVRWQGRPVVAPWHPGGPRAWVTAACVADLDGDGRAEALFGRTGGTEPRVALFQARGGRFESVAEAAGVAGEAFAATPAGLVAITGHARPQESVPSVKGGETIRFNLMRWQQGRLNPVVQHEYSGMSASHDYPGAAAFGTLAGDPAIVFSTMRQTSTDPLGRTVQGQRLHIIHGDPLSAPVDIGLPRLQWLQMHDMDGDGESEILALFMERLVVYGRRRGPPPTLPRVEPEEPPKSEAETLMRSVQDLLEADSFEPARDLLAEITERFPSAPEAIEARRLRCDVLLRAARLDFARAARLMNTERTAALEWERAALAHCRSAAKEAREAAAAHADRPDFRRRMLLMAAEAARQALDFDAQMEDLRAALACAAGSDDEPLRQRLAAVDSLRKMTPLIDGDPAADPLPFVTDAPSRVRRQGDALEAVIDAHSAWLVAGVPIDYVSGGLEFAVDFELTSSVWSASARFGFVSPDPDERPVFGSIGLWLHGTTAWDLQSASFALPDGRRTLREEAQHTPERAARPGAYRGRWRISCRYLPEVNLQTLEIRSEGGELVFSRRGPAEFMGSGRLVFGVAIWYAGGDALLSHGQHPPYALLRLSKVSARAVNAHVDRVSRPEARALELAAGGRMFRGDRAGAAELYRRAIERDARLVRARIHLAVATDTLEPLSDALRVDPYETVCALDDAMRGVGEPPRLALGALLRRLRDGADALPRAACLSLMGDFDDAAAVLKDLPDSPARRYLLERNPDAWGAGWDWLTTRGLRTPAQELPPLVWAPGPDDTVARLREIVQEAVERLSSSRLRSDALRAWVAVGRLLLLDPDNVAMLRLRADVSRMFGKWGPAEADYLRIADLRPGDPAAQLLVARFYAAREASRPTLEFLSRAIKAGLKDEELDAKEFDFLRENEAFRKLRSGAGE